MLQNFKSACGRLIRSSYSYWLRFIDRGHFKKLRYKQNLRLDTFRSHFDLFVKYATFRSYFCPYVTYTTLKSYFYHYVRWTLSNFGKLRSS